MRYFTAQDVHGIWYCLPEEQRGTWNRVMAKKDAYNYDAWDLLQSYKIDIFKLTFEKPNLALAGTDA
jgi:hypothetical protein